MFTRHKQQIRLHRHHLVHNGAFEVYVDETRFNGACCRRSTIRHTEDVFQDAEMLPPGTDHFVYAKPIIPQPLTAAQHVRLAPRTQRTATAWFLFLQCTMTDSNEDVFRDVFHAGLSWDVRRLPCAGQPIWLLAHIAFCLEEEPWFLVYVRFHPLFFRSIYI